MNKKVRRNIEKKVRKKLGESGKDTAMGLRAVSEGVKQMEETVNTLLNEGVELDEFGKVIMPQIKEFNEFIENNTDGINKFENKNLNKLSFEELVDVGTLMDEVNERATAIQATFQTYIGDL